MARVLVVEDNPASLDLMVYLLKAFGHTPLSARNGPEGIEVARREYPDLILCDIQLPGADGIQVCRELKADPGLINTPIVAVTAYAMVGDRERLLSEGFTGYLSKPINPQTFVEQIKPYLPNETMPTPRVYPSSANSEPRTAEFQGTILLVDDNRTTLQLSRDIFEPAGYQVLCAERVDTAMELLRLHQPDVILSDLHMPDQDGFDFIEAVKGCDELRKIPFVFVSSTFWAEHERVRAFSMGAVKFIVRPIEPLELINEIESCRTK